MERHLQKTRSISSMKRHLFSLFALFGLLFLFAPQSQATHVMGADITYRCIDTLKFEFVIKYYRSCKGVGFSNPSSQTRIKCATGGGSVGVSLSLNTIRDVTPVCATATKPCNPKNTYGTGEGIEEHEYTVTIDFNKAPYSGLLSSGCCQFIIETGQCCRNSDITTGAANQNFYTFAMMDLCKAPCNSSPVLTTEPIAFLCCNQPFYYNNGASDTAQFDSLSYSFSTPLKAWNSQIGYSGKYSATSPFDVYDPTGKGIVNQNANPPIGIYLDPKTGDLIFTPDKCDEITVAVLEVKEWRKDSAGKYQLIGITRRDMQFITKTCPGNNPPVIDGPYSYNVCEGTQLCFNITTDDKVKVPPPPLPTPDPDTVQIKWNKGIPGAKFTVTNPTALHQTGRFCWTPPVGSASDLPYSFTVTARDDACPLNAVTVRAFTVLVKPIAETEVDIDTLACGRYSIKSTIPGGFKTPAKYTWQIRDSTGNIIFDRKKVFFESTGTFISRKQKDTIRFRQGGKYIIQHTIENSSKCPNDYYDTLVVPPLLEVDLALGPDTFVCAGTVLKLQPPVVNGANPIKYLWSTGDTTDYLNVSIPNRTTDSTFGIQITDKNKCVAWDSIKIFLKENPLVFIGRDRRICTYDTIHLVPNDSLAYWDDPRDTTEIRVRQGDTLFKEWYLNGVYFADDSMMATSLKGQWVIKVIDSIGCFATDTMNLFVNDTVIANAGADQTVCWNDFLRLPAGGLDTAGNVKTGTYRWWDITNPPTRTNMGTADTLKYNIRATTNFQLELYVTIDTTTCYDADTVKVTVNPLPKFKMPPAKEICCDAGVLNLRLDEDASARGGTWYCAKDPTYVSSGSVFETALACGTNTTTHKVTYRYVDPSTGCVNKDSFDIKINPLPDVTLRNGYFCQDKGTVNLKNDKIIISPGNPSIGRQEWNCLDCKTYDWKKILKDNGSGAPGAPQDFYLDIGETAVPLGAKDSDTIVIEFVYRSQFGCYNRDTATIAITKVPKITFRAFPELCWDEGKVDLKTLSQVTPYDGIWKAIVAPGFQSPVGLNAALKGDTLYGDTLNTLATPEPSYAGGPFRYKMRFYHDRSGCPTFKDTNLIINPLPKPQIFETPLQTTTGFEPYLFCENNVDIPMSSSNLPGGAWSSPHSGVMAANVFKPSVAPTDNPFYVSYKYVDAKGCRGSDSVQVQIEALPKISILNEDTSICRTANMMIPVTATYSNTSGITWVPFKGSVSDNKAKTTNYSFTSPADTVGRVSLYVQTEPGNACPFVDDIYFVTIHPIPNVTLTVDDPKGCNPHSTSMTAAINNKIDPATATYAWTYSDGGSGNTATVNHQFTTNGTNTIDLIVKSAFGCDTALT
ncbi:MAG: hypothetical protein ACI83I_002355, partial [Bacteroidia bacterium]